MFAHLSSFFQRRNSRAIGLVFLLQGALFGTWSAFIPLLKQKFGLDDAQLGMLLLSLPFGVVIMNPVSVMVLQRLGAVKSTLLFLALAALLFLLPILAPNIPLLILSLFLAGSAFSIVNVAMNTSASLIENNEQVRIISTCHGLWSTGAMSGSALAGMAIGLGFSPLVFASFLCVLALLAVSTQGKSLRSVEDYSMAHREEEQGKQVKFAMPNKILWGIIALSICTNLTEGTLSDWAAVYMRDVVHAPTFMMGWGFAAYAFWMAAGRFMGDALLERFGDKPVLQTGGLTVAAGFAVAVFFPQTWTVLAGFAMVGAGVSLGAPILYAAAARVPGMAQGAGLATMNTFAMIGFLGGPAVIGFIAKAYSLPVSFSVVMVAAVFWAWKAGKI